MRRGSMLAMFVVLAVAAGLLGGAGSAAGVTITEVSEGINPDATLGDIAVDRQGNVWFTEGKAARVGRIDAAGVVTEYVTAPALNPSFRVPVTTVAVGRTGSIWASGPDLRYIVLGLTPQGETIFTTDANSCETASQLVTGVGAAEVVSASAGCASGSGGTESFGLYEGRFGTQGATPLQWTVGCAAANGPFIATGPAGQRWVSCYDELDLGIARVTPGAQDGPAQVDWYGPGSTGGFVGIPGPVTVARDGSVWFTQSELPPVASAYRNAIGRISPQGQVTSFQAGLTGMGYHASGAHGITVGPDGNIWFTEPAADRIGRITPAGVITEFALAPGANPQAITAGPGRTLWFTQPGVNRIGRIDLNEAPGASIGVGGSLIATDPVSFDGAGSSDGDGTIVDHRWDFGDGSAGAGARASHAYARAGTYTVTLVVTDNEGAQARAQRQVTIVNPAVRVQQTTASVRWDTGGAFGRILVSGRSDRAAQLSFTLLRGGTRLRLGQVSVPAGEFSLRLSAPRPLRPGRYQLVGAQVSLAGPPLEILSAVLDVAAPREGIVDRVAVLDARGRPARSVRPLGSRTLAARFHVLVAPRPGTKIEVRWSVPGRSKPIVDPSPKRKKGGSLVSSIFSRRSPLPQGLYVCQMRAGGVLVASVKMRIG